MSNAMLRDLAIQCGHSTFLGSPCGKCGSKLRISCERYHCAECHRKRSKKYNHAHRDDVNERSRKWSIANAEYIKAAKEAKR